jgi:hypothetical protein
MISQFREGHALAVVAVAASVTVSPPSSAAEPLCIVVEPGMAAFDEPKLPAADGAVFTGVANFALSPDDRVAFRASISGPTVGQDDEAIWVAGCVGDDLKLIAREGEPAPGTESGTVFASFPQYSRGDSLWAGRNDHVLFFAQLRGPALPEGQSVGLFEGTPSGARLMARRGADVESFYSDLIRYQSGTVAMMATDAMGQYGVFRSSGGGLSPVLKIGDPGPFENCEVSALYDVALSSGRHIGYRVALVQTSTTPCPTYHALGTTPSVLVGDELTGLPVRPAKKKNEEDEPSIIYSLSTGANRGPAIFGSGGTQYFAAELRIPTSSGFEFRDGIVSSAGHAVLVTGQELSGTGATITSVGARSHAHGSGQMVAWLGASDARNYLVSGSPGSVGYSLDGAPPGNTLDVVWVPGDPAPGDPSETMGVLDTLPAINRRGQLAFGARTSNGSGLFVSRSAAVDTIVMHGESVDFGGVVRAVINPSPPSSVSTNDGRATGFNDRGSVAFSASLTNPTEWAILLAPSSGRVDGTAVCTMGGPPPLAVVPAFELSAELPSIFAIGVSTDLDSELTDDGMCGESSMATGFIEARIPPTPIQARARLSLERTCSSTLRCEEPPLAFCDSATQCCHATLSGTIGAFVSGSRIRKRSGLDIGLTYEVGIEARAAGTLLTHRGRDAPADCRGGVCAEIGAAVYGGGSGFARLCTRWIKRVLECSQCRGTNGAFSGGSCCDCSVATPGASASLVVEGSVAQPIGLSCTDENLRGCLCADVSIQPIRIGPFSFEGYAERFCSNNSSPSCGGSP